jgi:DNA gyrase subunit A
MGRDTQGVKGMNVKGDDYVLDMEIVPEKGELLVITERGYGKRTPLEEYPVHKRGGMGVKTIQLTEKKGDIAAAKVILPRHELMLISEEGVVIRVGVRDISKLGRSTQGVRIMNIAEHDRLSAVARVSAKKRKRPVAEGQEELPVEEAEEEGPQPKSKAEALAEELAAEEFDEEE